MPDIYQIAQIGLQQVQDRVNAHALNAAHATMPGYRRQVSTAAGVDFAQLIGTQNQAATNAQAPARGVDLTIATASATGRALDASLADKTSFFVVKEGDNTYLTRHGNFKVDADGWLVGQGNLRVIGESGEIFVGRENVSLSADGYVMSGERKVARLSAVSIPADAQVSVTDQGLLRASKTESSSAALRVGFIEGSNTDSTREMIGMMQSVRQYESMVRLLQNYDEILGRSIQKLGEM